MESNKPFHGYNCYSAAIGEYCIRRRILGVQELILSQWSFFFERQMLLNGQWYTGAADGPVDLLLQNDLEQFCALRIEEHYPAAVTAEIESRLMIERDGEQVILVDFYYLESVRWEHLLRFGIEHQHDPHFILLEGVDHLRFGYLDPYYNYKGQMEQDLLREARSSITRQGGVAFRYYSINQSRVPEKLDLRETLHYRFLRYLKEGQYMDIGRLGETFISMKDFILEQKNCRWALDGYFCLKSIIDQHQNLRGIASQHGLILPPELSELENEWALLRKQLFSIFVSRRVCQSGLQELGDHLQRLANREETFVREVIDTL